MATIKEIIENQQSAGIDDFAYTAVILMCLMPTRFCVFPFNVGVERSDRFSLYFSRVSPGRI